MPIHNRPSEVCAITRGVPGSVPSRLRPVRVAVICESRTAGSSASTVDGKMAITIAADQGPCAHKATMRRIPSGRVLGQSCSSPRRMAMVTACVRSLAPSLSTRFLI